jgi:hypothetical protein
MWLTHSYLLDTHVPLQIDAIQMFVAATSGYGRSSHSSQVDIAISLNFWRLEAH